MGSPVLERTPKYSTLQSEERTKYAEAQNRNRYIWEIFILSLTAFIAVLVGFFLGRMSLEIRNAGDLLGISSLIEKVRLDCVLTM